MSNTIPKPLSRKRLNLGDDNDDNAEDLDSGDANSALGGGGGTASFKLQKTEKKRVNPLKAAAMAAKSRAPPQLAKQNKSALHGTETETSASLPAVESSKTTEAEGKKKDAKDDDEDDDYLSMSLSELPTPEKQPETYSQRRARKARESEAKARVLSKAELAAFEKQRREEGLKKSLLEDKQSRGYKLMKAMGWNEEASLGRAAHEEADKPSTDKVKEANSGEAMKSAPRNVPVTEPIALTLKEDRGGIGHLSEEQKKFREKMERIGISQPPVAQREDAETYRERIRLEREERRAESQFYAAQKILEEFDRADEVVEEPKETKDESQQRWAWMRREPASVDNTAKPRTVPLKSVPLLYRSLVKHREEKERNKKARLEFKESLSMVSHSSSKAAFLPGYTHDHEERVLFGETAIVEDEGDGEQEDEELQQFNQLSFVERLAMIVKELREKWLYCFWCKYRYGSMAEMEESCPGIEEDLHG
ncbi:hypothetical protein BDZ91DRAFT_720390 [Kalaharituber pfeilii]|nr:hypothetical protein BDZ91DRAFT_720390 [Kalaharituber pfeilii]